MVGPHEHIGNVKGIVEDADFLYIGTFIAQVGYYIYVTQLQSKNHMITVHMPNGLRTKLT